MAFNNTIQIWDKSIPHI